MENFAAVQPPLFLRQLYTPIQPSVHQVEGHVTYREFLPAPRLQPYIFCYWELKTNQLLEKEFLYRVVADGCIDIFFEPGHPDECFVMGFCRRYTEFPLERHFRYVGIRFLPTIFPQLFGIPASALSNRFEILSAVLPDAAQFITNTLSAGLEVWEMLSHLDNYLMTRLSQSAFNLDARLYGALHLILKKHGVLNVETDLDTGISPRQLRRLFEHYVGDTPKTFSKVVRFQNILKAKPSTQSLRENKLFYDGYYDQAHFIKEFKTHYGVTPSQAFGR